MSATDSPCPVRAFFTMSQKSSSSGIRMPSGDRRGAMGLHFSSSVTGSLFNGPCSLTHPTGQSRLAPQKVREARHFQYRPSQTPQQCCERRSCDHDCPFNEQEFAYCPLPLTSHGILPCVHHRLIHIYQDYRLQRTGSVNFNLTNHELGRFFVGHSSNASPHPWDRERHKPCASARANAAFVASATFCGGMRMAGCGIVGAWMMPLKLVRPPDVRTALPTGMGACFLASASTSDPAARLITPATPPPMMPKLFAAFTMAWESASRMLP